ncbi:FKBP-type peptidyl-prolyl cis-trans isomerase [Ectothiorhodospira sp. A-7Y]|nr:FKBP-type peptidyl-prolyl cis-trans isomerase [Ectothiorhodospira lacustris]MCG5522485.1 FKBP-type peptidyl-prolyl cis-trans isomerase [Ectothiorhodospira lacustris]
MHFRLCLEDGAVADDTRTDGGEPVTFTVGTGELLPGLEAVVMGLAAGDHRTVTLPPEQAYGFASPRAVQTLDRDDFPPDLPLKEGLVLGFDTPTGEQIPGLIRELREDGVTVDFNHPLAGQTVTVTVEILAVDTK